MPAPAETPLPEESATAPQLSPEQQISDRIEQSIEASLEKNNSKLIEQFQALMANQRLQQPTTPPAESTVPAPSASERSQFPVMSSVSPLGASVATPTLNPTPMTAFADAVAAQVERTMTATTAEMTVATEEAMLDTKLVAVFAKAVTASIRKARETAAAEKAERALAILAIMPQAKLNSMIPVDAWDVVIRFLSSEGATHTRDSMHGIHTLKTSITTI
jgi:hypothetical protein